MFFKLSRVFLCDWHGFLWPVHDYRIDSPIAMVNRVWGNLGLLMKTRKTREKLQKELENLVGVR